MPGIPTERSTISEAVIFGRVFSNGRHALTPELARHVLALGFSAEDKERMHALAVKNQDGNISADELRELDCYYQGGGPAGHPPVESPQGPQGPSPVT